MSETEAPEAPEPEAPDEAEPTETPEPEPTREPEDDLKGREAKARREALNLREQLKRERAERDAAIAKATGERDQTIEDLQTRLRERDAQLAAAGRMRDPRDITRYIDVGEEMSAEDLDAAITKLLKDKPYLGVQAAVDPHAVPQGQQNGNGGRPNDDANDWLRSAITGH
jgi:multidrug efflux pump subunit AcrA (membrane-fusion protein)